MYDVFKEIKEDDADSARIAMEQERLEGEIKDLENAKKGFNAQRTTAENDKPWYLFGKTRTSSTEKANLMTEELRSADREIAAIRNEYRELKSERETKFAEFAEEKEKLSNFLKLTSGENVERQEKLVAAALNFVETTDEKTKSVLNSMVNIKGQISVVEETNGKMQRTFTVIKKAELGAAEHAGGLSKEFGIAAEGEGDLEAMERKHKLESIDDHITVLASSSKVTQKTSLKLSEEALTIKSLRDNNRLQIASTKDMNNDGTASIANRLISTLTSFSAAALNEAKVTTANTLRGMDDMTRSIMEEDVIQAAAGAHIENDELAKLIDKMAQTADVGEEGIEIQRSALEMRKKLSAEANDMTARFKEIVAEAKGLETEALESTDSKGAANENGEKHVIPSVKAGLNM